MYNVGFFITEPTGNNEFSHRERLALGSEGKIYIPPMREGTVDDLEIGTEIAFEEVVDNKLISCVGLKNFISTSLEGISIYIFDNHNHALFFRYRHTKQFENIEDAKPFKVIHIDQHSDIKPNINSFDAKHISPAEIFGFTNYACNVGNFITSAKDSGLIQETIQIRTETALHSIPPLDFQNYNYILDIDIDFREGKNGKEIEDDFEKIRQLTKQVCLITIATSPYFMNQNEAIALIKKLYIN